MHIVFLTSEYPHMPSGGIGTSICNLARALVASGHRATVLGCGAPAEFDDRGVHVRFLVKTRVPKLGWLLNRRCLLREIGRLVCHEGADLVETPDWIGLSAGLHPPCPVVIRCNGSATYFADLLGEQVRPSIRWAEWLALSHAQDVVAVSRFTAERTRQLFRLRRQIAVIPNGIDVGQFVPAEPGEVVPETILYFGSLMRKKGVLDLAPIFAAVLARRPGARLVLVGRDVPDRRTGAASTWGLIKQQLPGAARKRVAYMGSQPYETMQEHIRRAGVCLFPSYAEALPVSWLEAMACAKAVIAYDIGWAPELIESGSSGLLVPTGDVDAAAAAIAELLADPGKAHALGLAARQRVEACFATDVVARRSIERYQQVLNSSA
jgi:glycosyltransferase involved in cell wall biosynthesis